MILKAVVISGAVPAFKGHPIENSMPREAPSMWERMRDRQSLT